MRVLPSILVGVGLVAGAVCVAAGQTDRPVEITSYGVGFIVGEEIRTGLARDGVGVDADLLARGFRDGLNGGDPLVSRDEMEQILALLHREMQDRMVRRLLEDNPEFKARHDQNLARSKRFHELFGAQEGVVTLPGGVQYKVLHQGSGRSPVPTDVVVLNERVTLLDGTVISEADGVETRVDAIIEGGIMALQHMRVGGRWQVAVPPALAHGAGGRMPLIGPNESIVGIVELVAIK